MTTKTIIVIYMFCGAAASSSLETVLGDKDPGRPMLQYSIAAVTAVLILWNLWMYRQAGKSKNTEAPQSAITRYTKPVAATASFILGMGILLV